LASITFFFSGNGQIFGLTFKAPPIVRHLAKFLGDRSRELGDIALQSATNKLKKNISSKTKAPGTSVPGDLMNCNSTKNTIKLFCIKTRKIGW